MFDKNNQRARFDAQLPKKANDLENAECWFFPTALSQQNFNPRPRHIVIHFALLGR
jgi:hypothetical protein